MKATVSQLSPTSQDYSSKQTPYKGSNDNFNGSRSSMSHFKKSLQSSMLSPHENQATVRVSISGNKKSLKVQDNESYDYYLGIYKEDLAQERQKNYMLNEKIKELKEFNDRFNPSRIIDLEQEIQNRDQEISNLVQENEQFRVGLEEASELQSNLQKVDHDNNILRNENKLLKNEISLLNQKLSDMNELESNCKQLNDDCQSLLTQNEQLTKDYQNISSEYSSLRESCEELISSNNQMSQQLETLSKSKKNLESRIALYSGQISALEKRADQVGVVEQENMKLKTQMKAIEQELTYLEDLAAKHDETDTELSKCKSLIEDYKEGLQEADKQIVKLKEILSENSEWKERFFEAEKKLNLLADSSAELGKIKSVFSISDRANNQLLNENSVLVNNNETLKYKLESKEKELERLIEACNRHEETIEKLIKDNEELSNLLRTAESSLEELSLVIKEKEKVVSNLNYQNSQVLSELKTIKEERDSLRESNAIYKKTISELHSQIHDFQKELEKFKGSSNEIVKERDYLKSKFVGVEDKLTKVSALEFELEKTKAKLNVSETLRNSTQESLNQLQEKYKSIKEEANLYEKFQILLTKNQQLGELLDEQNALAENLQKDLVDTQNENGNLNSMKSHLEAELKRTKENLTFWQEKYMKATKSKV